MEPKLKLMRKCLQIAICIKVYPFLTKFRLGGLKEISFGTKATTNEKMLRNCNLYQNIPLSNKASFAGLFQISFGTKDKTNEKMPTNCNLYQNIPLSDKASFAGLYQISFGTKAKISDNGGSTWSFLKNGSFSKLGKLIPPPQMHSLKKGYILIQMAICRHFSQKWQFFEPRNIESHQKSSFLIKFQRG